MARRASRRTREGGWGGGGGDGPARDRSPLTWLRAPDDRVVGAYGHGEQGSGTGGEELRGRFEAAPGKLWNKVTVPPRARANLTGIGNGPASVLVGTRIRRCGRLGPSREVWRSTRPTSIGSSIPWAGPFGAPHAGKPGRVRVARPIYPMGDDMLTISAMVSGFGLFRDIGALRPTILLARS